MYLSLTTQLKKLWSIPLLAAKAARGDSLPSSRLNLNLRLTMTYLRQRNSNPNAAPSGSVKETISHSFCLSAPRGHPEHIFAQPLLLIHLSPPPHLPLYLLLISLLLSFTCLMKNRVSVRKFANRIFICCLNRQIQFIMPQVQQSNFHLNLAIFSHFRAVSKSSY